MRDKKFFLVRYHIQFESFTIIVEHPWTIQVKIFCEGKRIISELKLVTHEVESNRP